MSRRRRVSLVVLALVFVVVPLVEIYFIVQLGQVIGSWWTIALLIAAGFLGSYLVRKEGRRAWLELQEALGSGRMPARELADGALILVGGTLLVTPGFLSDVVGLFCVLPVTRPLARALLARAIARRVTVAFRPPATGTTSGPPRGGPDVVTGEVVDDDR
jgi:UPF0716 protein FxsA